MRINAGTVQTWLTRAGLHAEKLHNEIFNELTFRHIQLDELWARVRQEKLANWLWVAMDAETKVSPASPGSSGAWGHPEPIIARFWAFSGRIRMINDKFGGYHLSPNP